MSDRILWVMLGVAGGHAAHVAGHSLPWTLGMVAGAFGVGFVVGAVGQIVQRRRGRA